MSDIPVQAAEYLPEDIEIRILSLCPAKSLLRFRCVSKRWLSLITDQKFIQLHLTQSISLNREHILTAPEQSFDPLVHSSMGSDVCNFTLDYVGSCNGLVCFSMNRQELVVFNPTTRVYKELPLPTQTLQCGYRYRWGFGYDTSGDDYKLVLFYESCFDYKNEIMVLSFKDNFWRKTHEFYGDDCINFANGTASHALFLNGSLHWVGFHMKSRMTFIISFDLSGEVFMEIPGPDELQPYTTSPVFWEGHYMWVIRGCLCVTRVKCGIIYVMNTWAMKEHNVKSSWVNLSEVPSISPDDYISPLFSLRNGEILVAQHSRDLVAYYLSEEEEMQKNTIIGDRFYEQGNIVALYTESLVSPTCGKEWRGNQLFMDFMANKVAVLDVETLNLPNGI